MFKVLFTNFKYYFFPSYLNYLKMLDYRLYSEVCFNFVHFFIFKIHKKSKESKKSIKLIKFDTKLHTKLHTTEFKKSQFIIYLIS